MKGRIWLLKWRGKVLVAALSACITCIVALLACELFIRLNKPYITPDTAREASLEYESSLFARHVFPTREKKWRGWGGTVPVYINERGYRGKIFKVPKQKGTLRIIFLGGSSVFDPYAPGNRDWPHLVEEDLHARGHKNAEIINAGIPGHSTWDVLGRLYAEIWLFEPDFVAVYEAWNDIGYFGDLNPGNSLLRSYRPLPTNQDNRTVSNPFIYYTSSLDRFLSHSQMYVRLRYWYWSWRLGKIGSEGIIKGNVRYSDTYSEWGPRQYELNLRLIAATARHIGATPIYFTQARMVSLSNSQDERSRIGYEYNRLSHGALVRAFADCDKAVFNAAKAENVRVLDLSKIYSGRSELFKDHVHLNARGSEATAKSVGEFLAQLIQSASMDKVRR